MAEGATDQAVHQQYQTADLLGIRIETHVRHTENPIDLDLECARALGVRGDSSFLDVGCGPGAFLRYLRGHDGDAQLTGLDQSAGMIASAAEASVGLDIAWLVGEADALPFPDATFTAVSARHMLHHVPDIPAAVRELRRVTRHGGTVLVTTDDAHNVPLIGALENEAVSRFGLPASPSPSAAFSTANAPDLLRAVFPRVQETVLRNALVFTDPSPIVRHVMTMIDIQQAADDPGLLAEIHAWLTTEAANRLAAKGGVWRDPKTVGVHRCQVL
jgi:ubiquinone/menaquinone biosynthesis C-methylase UbiE